MAKNENKGFYAENVVEIVINGKKCEVNKYEAEDLKKKLSKKAK